MGKFFLKTLKVDTPYVPIVLLMNVYPKEHLHNRWINDSHVYYSIICNIKNGINLGTYLQMDDEMKYGYVMGSSHKSDILLFVIKLSGTQRHFVNWMK